MNYSNFGNKFTRPNGITQLMEDLGNANSSDNPNIIMLGGGNPALIPEANQIFVNELQELISSSKVDQVIGLYDGPQGNNGFRHALSNKLNDEYAWGIDADNISLSNGSQANFFSLFNLFAGEMPDGSNKKILFPLAPEYVGYADQGLSEDMFISIKPEIELIDDQDSPYQFKYIIDFAALKSLLDTTTRCFSQALRYSINYRQCLRSSISWLYLYRCYVDLEFKYDSMYVPVKIRSTRLTYWYRHCK